MWCVKEILNQGTRNRVECVTVRKDFFPQALLLPPAEHNIIKCGLNNFKINFIGETLYRLLR